MPDCITITVDTDDGNGNGNGEEDASELLVVGVTASSSSVNTIAVDVAVENNITSGDGVTIDESLAVNVDGTPMQSVQVSTEPGGTDTASTTINNVPEGEYVVDVAGVEDTVTVSGEDDGGGNGDDEDRNLARAVALIGGAFVAFKSLGG